MRRWDEIEQVGMGCVCFGVVGRVRWSGCVAPLVVLVGVFVCTVGLLAGAAGAADSCLNARFRSGVSAGLPDCRAYELVTPVDKGRTQALTFTESAKVIASGDGERIALEATVPFGPNPSLGGARAVFSRSTGAGWEMDSAVAPGAGGHIIRMEELFSPDLSQITIQSETGLNVVERSPDIAFEVGPVGGPYALVASIPREEANGGGTHFLGASADFGHVLFVSVDHELPLSGVEGAAAVATDGGAYNLYDWSGGRLHLVNVKQNGSPLANPCGATLGAVNGETSTAVHAVSGDGSKVFFTVPSQAPQVSGPGCEELARLFMRVGDGEPVEVSASEPGVEVGTAGNPIASVRYNYASPDGSKVFFNTEMALTSDDASKANKLFEYDTEAPEGKRLKRIADSVPAVTGVGPEGFKGFFFSEDGSVVYVESLLGGELLEISRYETGTGKRTFVALAHNGHGEHEPSYSTPNGEFFLFTSKSVLNPFEPRGSGSQQGGKGPNELYRYDHASGGVMCVTCGAGDAPAQGEIIGPVSTIFAKNKDEVPPFWTQISGDGQRVFFQTTARLVPQDTNSTETDLFNLRLDTGLDVYEWEARGVEEAPGVFCGGVFGCTHLLSAGEDVGPSRFLGASGSGRDVFFESAAELAPQDVDEFPDIYDARVGGGFAPPPSPLECLSCQGVGSPPPLFSVPASVSFVGAGNPATHVVEEKPRSKKVKKKKKKKLRTKVKTKSGRGRGGLVRLGGGGA